MPWTAADADKHIKGLTKKQRKKWAAIANGVLDSCKGEASCEGKAVRIANSKFDMSLRSEEFARAHPEFKVPFNPLMKSYLEDALKLMSVNDEEIKQTDKNTGEIPEMEIFRPGTHNGEPFEEKDLQQIADNFHALKGEVRPKLKITHREHQNTLAGLMSYGDVVDVFLKQVADGSKRLFANVANVPKQVIDWIRDRRFPERSIELYNKIKLGTSKDEKIYRNVLKNIALLGSDMPAVTGMEPVKLSEELEKEKAICFGEACFPCEEEAAKYKSTLVSAQAIAEMLFKRLNR